MKTDTSAIVGRAVGPLSIGFSGHRWNRIPRADAPVLHLALTALYDNIDRGLAICRQFQSTPPVELCCGLAEGADQVAAQAMPAHWQLTALLALPKAEFRRHLEDHVTGDADRDIASFDHLLLRSGTRYVELPGRALEDDDAAPFVRLRDALVARSHVLLAVWDETAGAMSPGGTADVLMCAWRAGKPSIVLPPTGKAAWTPYRFAGLDVDGTPRRDKLDIRVLLDEVANFTSPVGEVS